MKKVIFIKNALVLTATSLLLRLLGVFFKVWLAKSIGSEGIGLYQLVFSFYVLVATFATGGISTAVTRLVADELILGRQSGVKKIMKRSFALTLLIAAFSCLTIIAFAEPIATRFIGNPDAALSLRILSFSLIFMGISSCIKGYFIARRKTLPPSSAQIFEQIVRLVTVFWLVSRYQHLGIAYSCAAVLLADTIAELSSCIYLYLFYRGDVNRLNRSGDRSAPPFSVFSKI
ncbi:MAG: oligosaccharide flippase family protein, partial [Clostridia bacterium]|nr:oligosaccharide flippase family protein [Clostridia bacterium]